MTATTTDESRARREFANRIAAIARLKSPDLVKALALVPREDFVGPGPWKIMRPPFMGGYVETPDADPIHLYDTVAVALDASRHLNNGEPSGLLGWLDALDIGRGIRFLHIGCGVGYYTAIVAHAASSDGVVLALEADPELAGRARQNLAAYGNVTVRCATSANPTDGCFDAIFVNAGATEIMLVLFTLLALWQMAAGVGLYWASPVSLASRGALSCAARWPGIDEPLGRVEKRD
jgi:protein-L-isoaspartate(D-aspartate) O-methyltransferase